MYHCVNVNVIVGWHYVAKSENPRAGQYIRKAPTDETSFSSLTHFHLQLPLPLQLTSITFPINPNTSSTSHQSTVIKMDAAKNSLKDFMSKSGHHDTTVHEKVAPGVTHETINRERHEHIQTAIDKEVHQDHYHTSVQPVVDREVLPETHHHNLGAVEHRQFEHGNEREVAERLKVEAAQFHDKTIEGTERHTKSVAPTLAGEHIHHHVHETIQPIVQKETIEPHVVHTTVPIHEVHHNSAQHHTASALPAVSMADFKKQGGVLTGREERYDGFEGEPRSVGGTSSTGLGGVGTSTTGTTGTHGHHHGHHHGSTGTTGTSGLDSTRTGTTGTGLDSSRTGTTGTGLDSSRTGTTGSGLDSSRTGTTGSGLHSGRTGTTGTGLDSSRTGTTGSGLDSTRSGSSGLAQDEYSSGTGATQKTKPSLLDKLNPMKDSDHDGKKGLMD